MDEERGTPNSDVELPGLPKGEERLARECAALQERRPLESDSDAPDMGRADGPVDFDAMRAALGDCVDDESGPTGSADHGGAAGDEGDSGGLVPTVSESAGQASATYASARPRTIPPTRAPLEDPNVAPVIIASHDTVRSAPPKMTVPFARPQAGNVSRLGPSPAEPPVPPFASQRRIDPKMTMRMPVRPVSSRRTRSPTLVVPSSAPSARQKLAVFMVMLVIVTVCGIATLVWRHPAWVGME